MIMDKFSAADQQGQEKVVKVLPQIFSKCDIVYTQHIEDKGRVDIELTATTSSGKSYLYAIECKDRTYKSDDYDTWMLEWHKYNDLMKYEENGYKPIYINTFSDNKYLVWDVSKTPIIRKSYTTNKTTVEDNGKVTRVRYMLPTSGCCYSGTTLS
jgi:hypothetical protein